MQRGLLSNHPIGPKGKPIILSFHEVLRHPTIEGPIIHCLRIEPGIFTLPRAKFPSCRGKIIFLVNVRQRMAGLIIELVPNHFPIHESKLCLTSICNFLILGQILGPSGLINFAPYIIFDRFVTSVPRGLSIATVVMELHLGVHWVVFFSYKISFVQIGITFVHTTGSAILINIVQCLPSVISFGNVYFWVIYECTVGAAHFILNSHLMEVLMGAIGDRWGPFFIWVYWILRNCLDANFIGRILEIFDCGYPAIRAKPIAYKIIEVFFLFFMEIRHPNMIRGPPRSRKLVKLWVLLSQIGKPRVHQPLIGSDPLPRAHSQRRFQEI